MIKELKTSQLLEYRKMLNTMLQGIDVSLSYRQKLIEYDSVTSYELDKYDSFNDPERFYHIKIFDKGISIIRLYDSKSWFSVDPDKKYFHFAIRIYNFVPNDTYKLSFKRYRLHVDFGDFQDISDSLKYFSKFVNQLLISELGLSPLLELEIF